MWGIVTDQGESYAERLRDRSFTPGVRDVPKLLELWRGMVERAPKGERAKISKLFVRALGRADRPAASLLLRDLWQSDAPERALRVRTLSHIVPRVDVPEWENALARALAERMPGSCARRCAPQASLT